MTSATETDTMLYDVTDGIAVITFNRPDSLNAFLPDMMARYAGMLQRADADPQVRAVVVTGAGRGFCPGVDFKHLHASQEELNRNLAMMSVQKSPAAALLIGKPVVTAINGPAAGAGMVIAIAADARFAARTASFTTSFVKLGLVAEFGSSWFLTRLVGLGHATDLLITGRKIDADEALAMGLVDAVVDNALDAALAWARDVTTNSSPYAISVMKRQLIEDDQRSMVDSVERALAAMPAAMAHADFREAMNARTEKRQPNWS